MAGRLWDKGYPVVAWLVAAACLSVFWSHATPHLCYDKYWLSGDAGITVYNAWQVGDGRVLYRDIFEFKTPLFFYLWGALMAITGPSPSVAQWATLACVSAVAPIVAVVVRRLGGSRPFAVAAGVAPVTIFFAAWPFPFTPWLGWLMLALAAWSLERAFRAEEPDRGWLMRAGVFTGLFVMTIQSIGLFFAAGATLALLAAVPRRRWATAGWFVGGGLAAAVPFVVYFAATGGLGEAIWQTLVWPNKHYYSGSIKGHYPLAGVVEYFERRGVCKVPGAGAWWNRIYTGSVGAIPVLGMAGFFTSAGVLIGAAVRALRRRAAATPAGIVVVALAGAGFLACLPQVIFPSLSDPVHLSFAGLAVAIPLAIAAVRGPRAWRVGAQGLVILVALLGVAASAHRAWKWEPYGKKYRHYDQYVKKYANVGLWEQLTEPGDTWVHLAYGGWQYLTTGRHSGIAHTCVFNDEKYMSKREFARILGDLRERQPTLLVFGEKGHQVTFWRLDPTLAQRYFWNGAAWERREPPLPHDTLAPAYRTPQGETIAITQHGQELVATKQRPGGPEKRLTGSVRGNRVFLTAHGERYLVRRGTDGALEGQCGGRTCRLEPVAVTP